MKHKELDAAVAEAMRFIKIAQEAFDEDKLYRTLNPNWAPDRGFFPNPSRRVAAVKRASMDLTRALAELRRRKT